MAESPRFATNRSPSWPRSVRSRHLVSWATMVGSWVAIRLPAARRPAHALAAAAGLTDLALVIGSFAAADRGAGLAPGAAAGLALSSCVCVPEALDAESAS